MPPPTIFPSLSYTTAASSLPTHSSSSITTSSGPRHPKPLIVLDDDPTGTQTVHSLPVLTCPLTAATLTNELLSLSLPQTKYRGLFILTNTRALSPPAARALLIPLLRAVQEASNAAGLGAEGVDVVLRSDSTLRGHFPLENELVEQVMGGYDAWILAPAFFEGGRVTLGGVHYAQDGGTLVPVGETPSAKDSSFGFRASDMGEWVREKMVQEGAGEGAEGVDVVSIGADRLRAADAVGQVAQRVGEAVKTGREMGRKVVIVPDTFDEEDMAAFVAGCNMVAHLRLLYRTAASFVSARLRVERMAPVASEELFHGGDVEVKRNSGGLVIVGSYVPRTTAQREYLLEHCRDYISHFELNVEELLGSKDNNKVLIERTAESAGEALQEGKDAVISTSRKLITTDDKAESLRLGNVVSAVLVNITKAIQVRPKYVIAKGGITSSDIATEALGIKKATVLGQAGIGVPLWRSEPVDDPKWLHVPYIVFPGNVGNAQSLGNLVAAYR